MWTVMLSVVEWEHLTDDQKELHRTMRESWISNFESLAHRASALALEGPQETDRIFRIPPQSVCEKQSRLA
jgi:hypothetical protein